ncbi:hypothetical protein EDC56_1893 [Sinobacterium caligoides]|uniref:Uncharacterized protein n=1 Tax=Sinobacterium caligoides TaxID=933926 RepID=A0A3N2DNQ9_9GAMM|nr:hypothetical protein EDC56_1893 [Sinobacterium caligoides]
MYFVSTDQTLTPVTRVFRSAMEQHRFYNHLCSLGISCFEWARS